MHFTTIATVAYVKAKSDEQMNKKKETINFQITAKMRIPHVMTIGKLSSFCGVRGSRQKSSLSNGLFSNDED